MAAATEDGQGDEDVDCGYNFRPNHYYTLLQNTPNHADGPPAVLFKEGNFACQKDHYEASEDILTHSTWLTGLIEVNVNGPTGTVMDPSQIQSRAQAAVGTWFDFPQQTVDVQLSEASNSDLLTTSAALNGRSEIMVLRGPDMVMGAIAWAPTKFHTFEDMEGDIILYETRGGASGNGNVHPNQLFADDGTSTMLQNWWVVGAISPVGQAYNPNGDMTWFAYSIDDTLRHEMSHLAGLEDTDLSRYLSAGTSIPGIPLAPLHDDECEAVVYLHQKVALSATLLAFCSL